MKALNKAILDRLRGDESVTGRAAVAQAELATLLGTERGKPAVAIGGIPSSTTYPCVRFSEDTGRRSLGGEGIGNVMDSIYRMEIFSQARDGTTLERIADCLELLLDDHREAPQWSLEGDNRCYGSEVFVPYQGPFQDTTRDVFIGTMAFRFAEARP